MKARGRVPFEIKIMRRKLQSHISLISADGQNNERAEVLKAEVVVLVMDMFTQECTL